MTDNILKKQKCFEMRMVADRQSRALVQADASYI
jgi:hypothetical protein